MDTEKLQKLFDLKEKGFLSEEEFAQAKKKLLEDDDSESYELIELIDPLPTTDVPKISSAKIEQQPINTPYAQNYYNYQASKGSNLYRSIGIITLVVFVVMIALVGLLYITAEKKQLNVFVADRIIYGGSTGSKKCSDICSKYPSSVQPYLDNEWRVVTSSEKSITELNFGHSIWGPYSEWGCECIGYEYILEKTFYFFTPKE